MRPPPGAENDDGRSPAKRNGQNVEQTQAATTTTSGTSITPIYADEQQERDFREWQRQLRRRGHPDPHRPAPIRCSAEGSRLALEHLRAAQLVNVDTVAALVEATR